MSGRVVFFDCDGVIANTEVFVNRAEYEFFKGVGSTVDSGCLQRLLIGRGGPSKYDAVMAHDQLTLPSRWRDELSQRKLAAVSNVGVRIDGLEVVFRDLRKPHIIVSNSSLSHIETVIRAAEQVKVTDCAIISAEEIGCFKPNPAIYQYALDKFNLNRANVVVVEDSVAGVSAAVGAGLEVIGVTYGSHCSSETKEELVRAGAGSVAASVSRLHALLHHLVST